MCWAEISDACEGAIELTSNTSCTNIRSTVESATSSGIAAPSCGGTPNNDVWFRFSAAATASTITLSSLGTNLSSSGTRTELFSGSCGTLTSLACSNTATLTATGLTVGATYFIRVYSAGASAITSAGNFNICVTHPIVPIVTSGKSFINVSRPNGGTVTPGDTLEVRVSLNVRNNGSTYHIFRTRFNDTIPDNLNYVPGSLRLVTNEGLPYASYTDGPGDDFAMYQAANKTIRFNLGRDTILSPTNMPVGFVTSTVPDTSQRGGYYNSNTHRPRASGMLIVITYRVRVDPSVPFETLINYGPGAIRYRNQVGSAGAAEYTLSPNPLSFRVYPNYGLCENATGTNNVIAGSGDFGSGTAHNGANPGTVPGYNYVSLTTGNPGDGNYAVVKNLSPSENTNSFVIRPQSPSTDRVFGVWDIIGDHTGAADPLAGNPPPASGANGGYMLAVNAAYDLGVANNQTITGLCENTFYEFSAWFRNVCKRCGIDSAARGASSPSVPAGYIPSGPGDSSGVKPNLTFQIDGVDYYVSGNIDYIGQWGQWVKKGFVFRTLPGQTSITISIKNNAPGGGGNDWVMDDISLATCLPQLQFFPTISNELCRNSQVRVSSIVSTFYENYRYYQWERSTDGGATWHPAPLKSDIDSFSYSYNGVSYRDTIFYPEFLANVSQDGHQYRLKVGTTIDNLNNSNCNSYSAPELVQINIGACDVLPVEMGPFKGAVADRRAHLKWETLTEQQHGWFDVERSTDGVRFELAGRVHSRYGTSTTVQHYQFTDPKLLTGKTWYRLKMTGEGNMGTTYSRIISLVPPDGDFELHSVVNPFRTQLQFELVAPRGEQVQIRLLDLFGRPLLERKQVVEAGLNPVTLTDVHRLPAGTYVLLVTTSRGIVQKRVMKL